jgi:hypothetical protein
VPRRLNLKCYTSTCSSRLPVKTVGWLQLTLNTSENTSTTLLDRIHQNLLSNPKWTIFSGSCSSIDFSTLTCDPHALQSPPATCSCSGSFAKCTLLIPYIVPGTHPQFSKTSSASTLRTCLSSHTVSNSFQWLLPTGADGFWLVVVVNLLVSTDTRH